MTESLLTVDELATFLNVKKSFLYSRTRQIGPGTIPKIMVGKYVRFRLPDVLEWLERQNEDRDH